MGEKVRTLDEVVGANVRARRAGLGLKQSDLAETLDALLGGWSTAVVSRLEAGTRSTSVIELMALATTLNATLDELLDPLAVGDDRPVMLWGRWRIDARKLRVIVRGEVRVQTSIKGSKLAQRYGATDRGDVGSVMTLMKPSQGMPTEEEES
jgi:transcriptional regulator with XRE-family HTH domain